MINVYEVEDVADNNHATIQTLENYLPLEKDCEGTVTGEQLPKELCTLPLPYDLDIFEVMSDERISSRPRITRFLSKLNDAIQQRGESMENVHLNKLALEDSEKPNQLMIDWLYNYFRAFFSFDDEYGDMYGLIVNNTLSLEFNSEFKPLKETEYDTIAEKTVEFVLENIKR